MYTLFIQKKQGDNSPFPLTKQLHDFLVYTQANGIFVAPGHLSKDAGVVQILINDLLDKTNIQKFGIGNRYGGNYINIYEQHLDNIHKLWHVSRNNKKDHRKMVFVFNYKDPVPDLHVGNYQDVINQIELLAVAIGSSNFSYQTYGPINGLARSADKGEADILMFFDEGFAKYAAEYNRPELEGRMVLSKSINKILPSFFKQMFSETLQYILA